jgi:exodeoxyribonuclease VII small subunit
VLGIFNIKYMPAKFSYNDSLEEMEKIMREIETDEVDVDKLSDKVKRLSVLIKQCKKKLYDTEEEVQKVIDDLVD